MTPTLALVLAIATMAVLTLLVGVRLFVGGARRRAGLRAEGLMED